MKKQKTLNRIILSLGLLAVVLGLSFNFTSVSANQNPAVFRAEESEKSTSELRGDGKPKTMDGVDAKKTIFPTGKPVLTISKNVVRSDDRKIYENDKRDITYKVVVKNEGGVKLPAKRTYFKDDLSDPAFSNATVKSISIEKSDGSNATIPGSKENLSNINLGVLEYGDHATITYTVNPNKVLPLTDTFIDNTAIADAYNANEVSDVERILIVNPEVSMHKEVTDYVIGKDNNMNNAAEYNEHLIYTMEVKNISEVNVLNSHFIDPLKDTDFKYMTIDYVEHNNTDSGDFKKLDDPNSIKKGFKLGNIKPNQTVTVRMGVIMPELEKIDIGGDMVIYNRSFIKGENLEETGSKDKYTGEDETQIPIVVPNIHSTKSVTDDHPDNWEPGIDGIASPGEILTYTIRAENRGRGMLRELTIKDRFESPGFKGSKILKTKGVVYDNNLTPIYSEEGFDIEEGFVAKDLKQNYSTIVTIDIKLADDIILGDDSLVNIASVTDTEKPEVEIDKNPGHVTAIKSVTDNVAGNINIDGLAEDGESIRYNLHFKNDGGTALRNPLIKDVMDDTELKAARSIEVEEVVHKKAFDGVKEVIEGDFDIQKGFVPFENFLDGDEIFVTVRVDLSDDLVEIGDKVIENRAYISAERLEDTYGTTDKDTGEDITKIKVGEGSANITKKVSDDHLNNVNVDNSAEDRETLVYTIKVVNDGEIALRDIYLKDPFDDLEFKNSKFYLRSVELDGNKKDFNRDVEIDENTIINHELNSDIPEKLDVDSTIIYTIEVDLPLNIERDDLLLENTATFGAKNLKEEVEDSASIPIGESDVSGSKVVSDDVEGNHNIDNVVEDKETLKYTIEFTNTGDADSNKFTVIDKLDDPNLKGQEAKITKLKIYDADNVIVEGINDGKGVYSDDFIEVVDFDIRTGEHVFNRLPKGGKMIIEFNIKMKDVMDRGKEDVYNEVDFVGPNTPELPEKPSAKIPIGTPEVVGSKKVTDNTDKNTNIDDIAEDGEVLKYTVEFRNIGNADADDFVIIDKLDDPNLVDQEVTIKELKVFDANGVIVEGIRSDEGLYSDDFIELFDFDVREGKHKFNRLPKGGKLTLVFETKTKDIFNRDSDKIVNEIDFVSPNTPEIPEKPSAEIPIGTPTLAGKKEVTDDHKDNSNVDGFAEDGETLKYKLSFENNSEHDAKYLTLKDPLDDPNLSRGEVRNVQAKVYDVDGNIIEEASGIDILNGNHEFTRLPRKGELIVEFELVLPRILDRPVELLENEAVLKSKNVEKEVVVEGDIPVNKGDVKGVKEVTDDHKDNRNVDGVIEDGETARYTVQFTNTGKIDIKDFTITDSLDDEEFKGSVHEVVSFKIYDTEDEVKLDLDVKDTDITEGVSFEELLVGETVEVVFDVKFPETINNHNGLIENRAVFIAKNLEEDVKTFEKYPEDPNTPEEDTVIPVEEPSLKGVKSVTDDIDSNVNRDGVIEDGETARYTIRFTNDGKIDLLDVLIKDTFEDVEFNNSIHKVLSMSVYDEEDNQVSREEYEIEEDAEVVCHDYVIKEESHQSDGKDQDDDIEREHKIGHVGDHNMDKDGLELERLEVGHSVEVVLDLTFPNPINEEDGIIENRSEAKPSNMKNKTYTESDVPEDGEYTKIPVEKPKASGTKDVTDSVEGNYNIDGIAELGETLEYTISFTNDGNVDLYDLVVYDKFEDTEFEGASFETISINLNGEDLNMNLFENSDIKEGIEIPGKLLPQEKIVVKLHVKIADEIKETDGTLFNQAFLKAANLPEDIPTTSEIDPNEPYTSIELGQPHLEGIKTVTDDVKGNVDINGVADGNETIMYKIVYTNMGDVAAYNVFIKDELKDNEFAEMIDKKVTSVTLLDEDDKLVKRIKGQTIEDLVGDGINFEYIPSGHKAVIEFGVIMPKTSKDFSKTDLLLENRSTLTGYNVKEEVQTFNEDGNEITSIPIAKHKEEPSKTSAGTLVEVNGYSTWVYASFFALLTFIILRRKRRD